MTLIKNAARFAMEEQSIWLLIFERYFQRNDVLYSLSVFLIWKIRKLSLYSINPTQTANRIQKNSA